MTFSGCSSVTLGGVEGDTSTPKTLPSLRNSNGQPVTLSIGNNNANSTFSGGLVGSGGVVKIGSGAAPCSPATTLTPAPPRSTTAPCSSTTPWRRSRAVSPQGRSLWCNRATGATGWSAAQLGSLLSPSNFTWGANSVLGIDTTNGNFSYGGGIAGQMGLVKLGSNMLTLTGANSYSGSTAINGGVLAMSNAPNSTPGSIAINAGGALSVSGAYNTVTGWLNSGLISHSFRRRVGPGRREQRGRRAWAATAAFRWGRSPRGRPTAARSPRPTTRTVSAAAGADRVHPADRRQQPDGQRQRDPHGQQFLQRQHHDQRRNARHVQRPQQHGGQHPDQLRRRAERERAV